MKHIRKLLSVLLLLALLLSSLAACAPTPEDGDKNKPSETTAPAETEADQNGTPNDRDSANTGGESGTLGEPTLPEAPKIEKPENPAKSLYEKSRERYDNGDTVGNLGSTGMTLLAEYNVGVDFDTYSYRDHTNKIFYLYLPCRADLSAVTFTVTHRDGSVSGPYTADFSDDVISDNERLYGNSSVYTLKVLQSDLPTVMLQIDESFGTIEAMNTDAAHETYAYGSVVTTVTDEMAKENGWQTRYVSVDEDATSSAAMKIRGRGNATWEYSKKPYQFVTENAMNLLGLGSARKYILLANYNDAAYMRTQMAMEMGYLFDVPYTSEYRQVDVFMNGQYLGLYMLIEKVEVDSSRVAIDHSDDILFEKDNYAADEEFGFQTSYTNIRKRGFRVHSPETANGLTRAKAVISLAESALYTGDDDAFAKYFDLASWAKMYLLQMATMNNDAFYGSLFFYYNHEDGKLYACSPWDFDWSFGVSYTTSATYLDPMVFDVAHVEWMVPMLKHENFIRAILDEYYKYGGKAIIDAMPTLVDQYAAVNRLSAEMNETQGATLARYYPDSGVTDYDSAVAYLRDICVRRVTYMTNKMQGFASQYSYKIP